MQHLILVLITRSIVVPTCTECDQTRIPLSFPQQNKRTTKDANVSTLCTRVATRYLTGITIREITFRSTRSCDHTYGTKAACPIGQVKIRSVGASGGGAGTGRAVGTLQSSPRTGQAREEKARGTLELRVLGRDWQSTRDRQRWGQLRDDASWWARAQAWTMAEQAFGRHRPASCRREVGAQREPWSTLAGKDRPAHRTSRLV